MAPTCVFLPRLGAWCRFSASLDIWFRDLPPEPASLIWHGAGRNLSAYVWNALFQFVSRSPFHPFRLSLKCNNVSVQPSQPTPASSQRARSMWTWWGWISPGLATPWCTAVSMATSWRGALNTGSARATALGPGRCRYAEVSDARVSFAFLTCALSAFAWSYLKQLGLNKQTWAFERVLLKETLSGHKRGQTSQLEQDEISRWVDRPVDWWSAWRFKCKKNW